MSKVIEKYGYRVPENTPALKLELKAYSDGITEEQGGLGPEQHFKNAFRLMWPKYEWSEWVEMLIWAWCNNEYVGVIGCQNSSKTFSTSHLAYLDYCAAPDQTSTSLATVTLKGLRQRMWGDLMMAASTAAVPCPFYIAGGSNELAMYIKDSSRRELEKFSIGGLLVDHTQDARGKILGIKAPRRRFIGDEAEDINDVIYEVMTNITGARGRKIVMLSNPREKDSGFGKFNEPEGGWGTVNEYDKFWKTKNGGICIHFNGLESPNVKAGKAVFTGIITKEQVDDVERVNGKDSVAYWSRVLGFPAPDGMVSRVFSYYHLSKAKQDIAFDFKPRACATLDPAYERDAAPMHFGVIGRDRNGKECIQCTETITMHYQIGEPKHYQLARWVKEECVKRGVAPKDFIMDASGNASGTRDILMKEWSPEIQWIVYGGKATDRPVVEGLPTKASDRYERFVTELWFRAAECCAAGLIYGLGNLDEETCEDLRSRLYEEKQVSDGNRIIVETKDELKKRLGRSPDCFIAGTKILTPSGHKNIEEIAINDKVTTPMGDMVVENIIETTTDLLCTVELSNGVKITGKPKHRIFTWNRGWVRMDELSLTDEIESANDIFVWNILNSLFTKKKNIAFKHLVDTTSLGIRMTRKDFYTGGFGLMFMDLFLMVLSSIIKTGIGIIMILKTFASWIVLSIRGNTCLKSGVMKVMLKKLWLDFQLRSISRRNGTLLTQELSGTLKMVKKHGQQEKKSHCSVRTAESNLSLNGNLQDSAQEHASVRIGGLVSMLKKHLFRDALRYVLFAISSLYRGLTLMVKHAPIRATRITLLKSDPVKVYNLTVQSHNIYYANGILVENCGDAFCQFGELLCRSGQKPIPQLTSSQPVKSSWQIHKERAIRAASRYTEGFKYD